MTNSCIYVIICIILASTITGQKTKLKTVNGKIKISIGTSAGCPHTYRLINHELLNTFNKYRKFLNIQFIPWGRTQRNPNGSLTCQFGEADCFANKVHRCTLNMLRNDQQAQVNYMKCEFSVPYPAYLQGNYNCAQQFGLRLIHVGNCALKRNNRLDKIAEDASREPMKIINYVPAIWFNDKPDYELHKQALLSLSGTICAALADDPTTGVTCNN